MSQAGYPVYSPRLLMKEQRKLERFELRLWAEIETLCENKPGMQRLKLFTRNISSGGAFFDTLTPLPQDVRVKVGLVIEKQSLRELTGRCAEVKLNGSVLRSEPTGMAIIFEEPYQMLTVHRA